MKIKYFLFLPFLALIGQVYAQAPQGFNYQGVARSTTGEPLANQNISVKTSILSGSQIGPLVYSENHTATTNQFGLFTLTIGSGSAVTTTTFSAIDWSSVESKFLKVEIDPLGGSNYTLTGSTQLLSVPYALYAAKAGGAASSQWADNSHGIDFSKGKVAIGDATGEAWLQVMKNGTDADRSFLRMHNTSNLQESNVASYFLSGTGNNMAFLDITVNSKNYFPALGNGGQGIVRSEKLVLIHAGLLRPGRYSQNNSTSVGGYWCSL